jgi:holliday junction DNA helicase RuvB
VITKEVADRALHLFEVDELGMDAMDRRLLLTIIDKFSGGPVGIETLSSAISEERGTIEDIYEPFLMQRGFLDRTPRGRVATVRAYQHLGRTPKAAPAHLAQGQLWEQDEQP